MKLARWQNCARRVENCGSRPLMNRYWFQPNPLRAPGSHLPVAEGLRISPSSPGPAHHGGYTPLFPHSSPNPGHSPPYTSLTSPLPTSHLCPGPSTITTAQNKCTRLPPWGPPHSSRPCFHPAARGREPVTFLQYSVCSLETEPLTRPACCKGDLGALDPLLGRPTAAAAYAVPSGGKAPRPPHCLTSRHLPMPRSDFKTHLTSENDSAEPEDAD